MKKVKLHSKSGQAERDYRADAWERFEKAVDVALHTQAPHKPKTKPTAKRAKGPS